MDDTNKDLVLPKGSLILVTGTSGFIAGHIVNEALKIGYRVRGTVRSEDKAKWTQELFKSPDYETAIVPNMAVDGAFDEAVKGVDAIIHTASVMTRSPNPNEVIPDVVAGATNILKSAATEPSVKRFVFTSSSTAATLPKPGKKFQIDASTWNDEAVELAWKPPPYDPSRTFTVYAASKTQAERAVWKFVQENNPHFVVNAVNPNGNMGRILATTGPTGSWIPSVARGELPLHVPPQWMVNVTDDARIHLAAALDGSLANRRIFAYDTAFNWNDVIDAVHQLRPDLPLPDHVPGLGRDLSEPDNALGAQLLRKWWGQDGYRGLLQSVREGLEGVA